MLTIVVSPRESTLPPTFVSFPDSCSLRQPHITPGFSRSQATNSSLLDNARAEGKHLRIISTTTWLTGMPRGRRQEPNKRKGEQRKLKIWYAWYPCRLTCSQLQLITAPPDIRILSANPSVADRDLQILCSKHKRRGGAAPPSTTSRPAWFVFLYVYLGVFAPWIGGHE